MRGKIQKLGDSLAIRIPKAIAEEIGLGNDSPVEIRVVNGKIQIIPLSEPYYELDDLLAGITEDNIHGEI